MSADSSSSNTVSGAVVASSLKLTAVSNANDKIEEFDTLEYHVRKVYTTLLGAVRAQNKGNAGHLDMKVQVDEHGGIGAVGQGTGGKIAWSTPLVGTSASKTPQSGSGKTKRKTITITAETRVLFFLDGGGAKVSDEISKLAGFPVDYDALCKMPEWKLQGNYILVILLLACRGRVEEHGRTLLKMCKDGSALDSFLQSWIMVWKTDAKTHGGVARHFTALLDTCPKDGEDFTSWYNGAVALLTTGLGEDFDSSLTGKQLLNQLYGEVFARKLRALTNLISDEEFKRRATKALEEWEKQGANPCIVFGLRPHSVATINNPELADNLYHYIATSMKYTVKSSSELQAAFAVTGQRATNQPRQKPGKGTGNPKPGNSGAREVEVWKERAEAAIVILAELNGISLEAARGLVYARANLQDQRLPKPKKGAWKTSVNVVKSNTKGKHVSKDDYLKMLGSSGFSSVSAVVQPSTQPQQIIKCAAPSHPPPPRAAGAGTPAASTTQPSSVNSVQFTFLSPLFDQASQEKATAVYKLLEEAEWNCSYVDTAAQASHVDPSVRLQNTTASNSVSVDAGGNTHKGGVRGTLVNALVNYQTNDVSEKVLERTVVQKSSIPLNLWSTGYSFRHEGLRGFHMTDTEPGGGGYAMFDDGWLPVLNVFETLYIIPHDAETCRLMMYGNVPRLLPPSAAAPTDE